MDWKDIAQDVAKVAPILGTALGGPVGGLAGSLIAKTLGVESTPEAVQTAIATSPDVQVKLAQIESDQKVALAQLASTQAVAQTQLSATTVDDEVKDRDSARKLQIANKSYAPGILGFSIVFGLLAACGAIVMGFSKGDSALLGVVVHALLRETSQVVAYYFGGGLTPSDKD